MKTTVSLVLADVDGTLVTAQKRLTPRAIAAVRDLREAGISFAITSGRPPRGMAMLVAPLELRTPIAAFNGGVIANPDLSVIESHALDPATAEQALRLILDEGLDAWIYTGEDWLVRDAAAPHVAEETRTVQFTATAVASFTDAHLARAVKIVGVSNDHDLVAACEEKARQALGDRATARRSQPYYLDITDARANKGAVVEAMSRLLRIPAGKIAAIGDMPSDVPMFRGSGFSIAMGNASEEVKARATTVTGGNDADGFAEAMERLVLRRRDRQVVLKRKAR